MNKTSKPYMYVGKHVCIHACVCVFVSIFI